MLKTRILDPPNLMSLQSFMGEGQKQPKFLNSYRQDSTRMRYFMLLDVFYILCEQCEPNQAQNFLLHNAQRIFGSENILNVEKVQAIVIKVSFSAGFL